MLRFSSSAIHKLLTGLLLISGLLLGGQSWAVEKTLTTEQSVEAYLMDQLGNSKSVISEDLRAQYGRSGDFAHIGQTLMGRLKLILLQSRDSEDQTESESTFLVSGLYYSVGARAFEQNAILLKVKVKESFTAKSLQRSFQYLGSPKL